MFSNFSVHQNYPEDLLTHRLLDPNPSRISRAGWGWRICISNKFPGDVDVTGPGSHFENYCFWEAFIAWRGPRKNTSNLLIKQN